MSRTLKADFLIIWTVHDDTNLQSSVQNTANSCLQISIKSELIFYFIAAASKRV